MVDGVEDPQAGVGAVAAHDDDLHQSGFVQGVEPQKGLHQGEGGTLGQDIPLVADLVVLVCGESLMSNTKIPFLVPDTDVPQAVASSLTNN